MSVVAKSSNPLKSAATTVMTWFDAETVPDNFDETNTGFQWLRCLPFIALHLVCLLVFVVGVTPAALVICLAFYLIRMFAITGFYHRYFSHRSFKTNRAWQFLFALLACSSAQRGPLWWASHHRHHHQHSDTEQDAHSPEVRGFWWSHVGWFTCDANYLTREKNIQDFARFPELRFLNRFDILVPMAAGFGMFFFGCYIEAFHPALETNRWQVLIWGFFISTILLFHGTFTINSLCHVIGWQRYNTGDTSRNNWLLALITLGEGWHNNHHRWPNAARQGHRAWEFDPTWYVLWVFSRIGIIRDLAPIPARVIQEGRGERAAA